MQTTEIATHCKLGMGLAWSVLQAVFELIAFLVKPNLCAATTDVHPVQVAKELFSSNKSLLFIVIQCIKMENFREKKIL